MTNDTTKKQHSHTKKQHETRSRRHTHTIRCMEEKHPYTQIPTRMGYPIGASFFRLRERGTPPDERGIASGDGVPHRDEFFQDYENGVPHRDEKFTNVLFFYSCIPTRLSCNLYEFTGYAVAISVQVSRHSVVQPCLARRIASVR